MRFGNLLCSAFATVLFGAAAFAGESDSARSGECLTPPAPGSRSVVTVDPGATNRAVVRVEVPVRDVQQMWIPAWSSPRRERKWRVEAVSAPQCDMPYVAYFNVAGRNAFSIGSATLQWDTKIVSQINQEKGVWEVTVTVAAEKNLKPFEVTLDRRAIDWTDVLADWRNSLGYRPAVYPRDAWKPVYCSWYAVHAAMTQDWVDRTATIAADLGFKTFILDDGWSYDEMKRVNPETIKTWYRDTGKWDRFSSVKFPDFKAHRARMRELGLNYLVWVAPYFAGTRSEAFTRYGFDKRPEKPFEGNVLADPADREFLDAIDDQLVSLLRTADLDGLKIDFLDSICPSVDRPRGTAALDYMERLMAKLRSVKPHGLFEFRQSYATPIMAHLATQFRAGDVPFEWLDNLQRIAQIRLAMGDGVPIHADPIYWAPTETSENINRHFLAAMAGVPMVSMDLARLSMAERAVVSRWLKFYGDHVEKFQRLGTWRVVYRNGGVAILSAHLDGETLLVVNEPAELPRFLRAAAGEKLVVLNLSSETLELGPARSVPPAEAAVFASEVATRETPLLKIAVMSDIQGYPYPEDSGMRNLERALDVFAPLRPDVIVNVGDINDSGCDMDAVRYYKKRCDARLGSLPQMVCNGNHEICFIPKEKQSARTPEVCTREFNAVFGFGPQPLMSRTIADYDFIALNLLDVAGYSDEELRPLKAALDRAVRRDATKPIFVLTHYHPKDTVNSSGEASGGKLRKLLDAYPQVVNLSGHSHNPLQDPRSIWQGTFTALDTSTLCYGCIDEHPPMVNQISCLIPYGHESVGCSFIEVYADRLVIRRFSVRDRREIDADRPWSFALPYDPKNPTYGFETRAKAEKAPEFPTEVEPSLWYDYGLLYLMFAAAADPSAVYCYRIELSERGGETKTYDLLSDYYRIPEHRQNRVVFRLPPKATRPGGHYSCRIWPVGFFGAKGVPCKWEFDIRSSYPATTFKPNCMQE